MNGNTFTVEFWTTDPALGGAAARTRSGTVTGAMIAKLGAGTKGRVGLISESLIPSAYIDDFAVAQSTFNDKALLITNNGNFRAQPVIELSGPLTNVVLTNEANDEQIALVAGTTIPNGETWVLDIAERRMYRASDQANRFKYLDANSDWMELEPGENSIDMSATGTAVASQVNFDFHHTVM
jgi:tail protein